MMRNIEEEYNLGKHPVDGGGKECGDQGGTRAHPEELSKTGLRGIIRIKDIENCNPFISGKLPCCRELPR